MEIIWLTIYINLSIKPFKTRYIKFYDMSKQSINHSGWI